MSLSKVWFRHFFHTVFLTVVVCGCHAPGRGASKPEHISGESVVFVGDEPARLAFPVAALESVRVRADYGTKPGMVVYENGRDYSFDLATSSLRRLPGSRIPDFRTNILYGREDFDHSKFPGFGNTRFFAFVDYAYRTTESWPLQPSQAALLQKSMARLKAGGEFRIVAYGDSITAGGDATEPGLIFWRRWVESLQARHPSARIVALNGATGGDSTVQGVRRLEEKVLSQRPDLVLIGFGMNDHNTNGVSVPKFEENLTSMVKRIRERTGAEVVLFSAFPPNPKWHYGTHQMDQYAAATERVARQIQCAYGDVFRNWQRIARDKKPEDLLGNNINHPNDFGHWIYFQVLDRIGL